MEWIAHLFIGPVILLLALFYKLKPPQKINDLYGYRTPRSMKSLAVWKEANRYSSNALLAVALITCISQVPSHFLLSGVWMYLLPVILMCVLLIATIPLTEAHLKKHFDDDGNPRG